MFKGEERYGYYIEYFGYEIFYLRLYLESYEFFLFIIVF